MPSSPPGAHKEPGVNASVLTQLWGGGGGGPRIWTLPGLFQPRSQQTPSSPAAALTNITTVGNWIQPGLALVKEGSHSESDH